MAGISKVGKKGLQDGALTTTAASAPTVGAKGELFYNTTENKLYVSNGTAWTRVSNDSPSSTGGTVVISTLNEGATFSYNLGTNFTDDSNTDAELTYSLESGTLPGGATLPTSGNSAMTGTVGNVSSNTVYTFSIRATDVAGATATQDYQQQINTVAATVTGGTVTISSVDEGSSASYDVDTNFTYPAGSTFSAYSLQSGSLPSGLSFNTSTGVISGTMGTVSSDTAYSFTIRATDTDGDTADQAYSWTITNVPLSATGGTITTYSSGGVNYKVNTFTSSGTITFNKSGSVDVLVVGGGGAGGGGIGGGGGGGGVIHLTNSTVSATNYTVSIGGGGATQTGAAQAGDDGYPGGNGGSTTFSNVAASGGGGGGSNAGNANTTGTVANGGGGGADIASYHINPGRVGTINTIPSGWSGTAYGGFTGGAGGANNYPGSGGAGASQNGVSSESNNAGEGGNGKQIASMSPTGASYYWGGGGGGCGYAQSAANGGIGGGGGGAANSGGAVGVGGVGYNSGSNGSQGATSGDDPAGGNGGVNTGGGGGSGGHGGGVGGSGGSGIVIVRYVV